jgi:predicted Zn-dependent protease with MMP-like domain
MTLSHDEFEHLTQQIFDSLPEQFQRNLENVRIVIEDEPSRETMAKMRIRSVRALLGLYEGVPLSKRGTGYGMYPVEPDKITLFKKNLEAGARSTDELHARIRDTLIHEIAHYYGMSEQEVRDAGY